MAKEIYIVGTGGLAKEIAFIIDSIKDFKLGGFISNELKVGETVYKSFSVLGDDTYATEFLKNESFFIAIGDIETRRKVVDNYKSKGIIDFPKIIHPASTVAEDVVIGEGVVVYPGSIIATGSKIGNFSIINAHTFIGHSCRIGHFNNLSPGAIVLGDVSTGHNVLIGANSSIHQSVNICSNVTIGLGSVVVSNINKKGTYFGNPAKKNI